MQIWHGVLFSRNSHRLVREGLEGMGHKVFMPCEVRQVRGAQIHWPLVPYVFAAGDLDRERVLRIRGVIRFLRTATKGYAVATEEQICAMQAAAGVITRISAKPGMRPGDRVRIRKGALGEIEATVREIVKGRPVVGYMMLGKEHVQAVDPVLIEPAE